MMTLIITFIYNNNNNIKIQGNMKVFILHYSKLVDRKKHILDQLNKLDILDYEFIEKYDKDEITSKESSIFDINYKKSTMSLCLKHFYVFKEIAEKYDSALIFEDDVILSHNFTDMFNKYIAQLPQDYDMLFIGDGCYLHIENNRIIPNQYIYEKSSTRCADSYIVSKKCALKICKYIQHLNYKIFLPADHFLNLAIIENNLKVYWAEPTIVTQGTQNGLFNSTSDSWNV